MKTYSQKQEAVTRKWHLYDLKGKVLGRAATEIATLLIGKNKPTYTPHIDAGDYVVAINAKEVRVTGQKLTDKKYFNYSGFPGGLRVESLGERMGKDARTVIETAVKGMLPKNKLQTPRLRRLKVYSDATHPYDNLLNPKPARKEKDAEK